MSYGLCSFFRFFTPLRSTQNDILETAAHLAPHWGFETASAGLPLHHSRAMRLYPFCRLRPTAEGGCATSGTGGRTPCAPTSGAGGRGGRSTVCPLPRASAPTSGTGGRGKPSPLHHSRAMCLCLFRRSPSHSRGWLCHIGNQRACPEMFRGAKQVCPEQSRKYVALLRHLTGKQDVVLGSAMVFALFAPAGSLWVKFNGSGSFCHRHALGQTQTTPETTYPRNTSPPLMVCVLSNRNPLG